MVERRPVRRIRGMLADHPGKGRKTITRITERQNAGEEEQEIENEIERRLPTDRPLPIEEVTPHMAVARQSIRAGQHEKHTIEDVAHVERPFRGRLQEVAREDLVTHRKGEDDNRPGACLADGHGDLVNAMQHGVDRKRSSLPENHQREIGQNSQPNGPENRVEMRRGNIRHGAPSAKHGTDLLEMSRLPKNKGRRPSGGRLLSLSG